ADDRVERLPRARGAPAAAVDDEVLPVLRDLRVEVVHEHAERRLGLPRLAAKLRPTRGRHGFVRGHVLEDTNSLYSMRIFGSRMSIARFADCSMKVSPACGQRSETPILSAGTWRR